MRRLAGVLVLLAGIVIPKNATGPTPVRYVICKKDWSVCFVSARFKDMDDCERYRTYTYCDSVTVPGKIICDTTRPLLISETFCFP